MTRVNYFFAQPAQVVRYDGDTILNIVLDMLPPVYSKEEGALHWQLMRAWAVELQMIFSAVFSLLDQPSAGDATWTLDDWERRLGLAPHPEWSDSRRQARLLSRLTTLLRNDNDHRRWVRDLLGSTGMPTLYINSPGPGAEIGGVYKPYDLGWIEPFEGYQAAIQRAHPQNRGWWLAPWNTDVGLTCEQADRLAVAAAMALTTTEVAGAGF